MPERRIIVHSFPRPFQPRSLYAGLDKSGKCREAICYQEQRYDREIYLYDVVNSNAPSPVSRVNRLVTVCRMTGEKSPRFREIEVSEMLEKEIEK